MKISDLMKVLDLINKKVNAEKNGNILLSKLFQEAAEEFLKTKEFSCSKCNQIFLLKDLIMYWDSSQPPEKMKLLCETCSKTQCAICKKYFHAGELKYLEEYPGSNNPEDLILVCDICYQCWR